MAARARTATIALAAMCFSADHSASFMIRSSAFFPSRRLGSFAASTELNEDTPTENSLDRRSILVGAASAAAAVTAAHPSQANAMSTKSRTEGYEIQKDEREWASVLSPTQYDILRNGGTERPYSSVLEGEDRPGSFACAGCGTPLFESSAKFHSGTGWPSFATALPGVEVENVSPVQANLIGAELRCKTCGGHLGDVFQDGFLFVGTPAFKSGKRFCIDGSALIFKPSDGSEDVVGDTTPTQADKSKLPSFLEPPKITPRDQL
mmetsp:Transcript_223/g.495  ORF Transcript_223/g.495 Transcript_223/m.495 type:complete len:264 (-) Transcript_223:77-868(-)